MITVLILEDDEEWLRIYRRELKGQSITILTAVSVADAEKLLASHAIDVITVDGELVGGGLLHTCAFVTKLRADGFKGQLIAASSDPAWRRKLVEAGCNHDIEGTGKSRLPGKLVKVIRSLK